MSVQEKVYDFVAENLHVDRKQINEQTSLTDDLGADSLDMVELIMALEEEFDVQIPDEQAEKLKTAGDLAAYVEREQAKAAPK